MRVTQDINFSAVATLEEAVNSIASVLWGNEKAVRLLLATVLARGHILIEDVPGVGKTTLSRAMAKVLGSTFARIQFTADMLPADVLGSQILKPQTGELIFKKGPLFADVVLADEINRASPRTQSAFLEAMADRQVTLDGQTYTLAPHFVVIATQNPVEHHGVYPLPESQLDRFMTCTTLGYPPRAEERRLLQNPHAPEQELANCKTLFSPHQLQAIHEQILRVFVSDAVADYVLAVAQATRSHPDIALGVSPRGNIALTELARAWAYLHKRDFVLPDDIQLLAPVTLSHRMVLSSSAGQRRLEAEKILVDLLQQIPVPR